MWRHYFRIKGNTSEYLTNELVNGRRKRQNYIRVRTISSIARKVRN